VDERRNDVELKVLTERVDNLITQIAKDEVNANEWRGRLCKKVDVLMEKIDLLPCPSRMEQSKNVSFQLKALWAVTGGMVIAILSEWVKLK
jgi:hypothetical protein